MKRTLSLAHLRPNPGSRNPPSGASAQHNFAERTTERSRENARTIAEKVTRVHQNHQSAGNSQEAVSHSQEREQSTLLDESPDGAVWRHTKIRRLDESQERKSEFQERQQGQSRGTSAVHIAQSQPQAKASHRNPQTMPGEQQAADSASQPTPCPIFPIFGSKTTRKLDTVQQNDSISRSCHGGASANPTKPDAAAPVKPVPVSARTLAMALMSPSSQTSQDGGIFEDLDVVLVHRESHCGCAECDAAAGLLKQHGDAGVQRSLLQRKHNTLLSFLTESTTVVVVHKHTQYGALRSFLGIKPDTDLSQLTLCSFAWVHDSVAQGSVLPMQQFKWNGPEDAPPPAQPAIEQKTASTSSSSTECSPAAAAKSEAGAATPQMQATAAQEEPRAPVSAREESSGRWGEHAASAEEPRHSWQAATDRALALGAEAGGRRRAGSAAARSSLPSCADGAWRTASAGSTREDTLGIVWGGEGRRDSQSLASMGLNSSRGWAGDGGELKTRLGHWSSGEEEQGERSSLERSEDEEALERANGALAEVLPATWVDGAKHRFLCGSAAGQGKEVAGRELSEALVARPNQVLVKALTDLEEAYTALGDEWRKVAYKRAAAAVAKVEEELTVDNWREVLRQSNPRMRAIGGSISQKIEEVLQTGRIQKLDLLKQDGSVDILTELGRVWGVGPALAAKLYKAGVRSVAELVGKTAIGGVTLSYQAQMGALHFDDISAKIPRAEIKCIEEMVQRIARQIGGPKVSVQACGSYRRGKSESGDVDCLLTRADNGDLMELMGRLLTSLAEACEMKHLSLPTKKSSHGGCSYMGLIRAHAASRFRRIDIKAYPREQKAFALMHMTGSDHFNRSIRLFAMKKGLSLSDHGCCKVVRKHGHWGEKVMAGGNLRHCETERDIFELLHLDYVAPEDRHGGYTIAHLKVV